MKENKTAPIDQNVTDYLSSIHDAGMCQDCLTLDQIMREATSCKPLMGGESIVGYGEFQYKYASGREGDWMLTGFSARKRSLTIHITSGFVLFPDLLEKLGKVSHSKLCLYVKRLKDIDMEVLQELVTRSVEHMRKSSRPQ